MGRPESQGTPDASAWGFVHEVMLLFQKADSWTDLFWDVRDTANIVLLANCNDEFWWATADSERILPEDLPLLRQSFDDLAEMGEEMWLAELFAARKRGMRPQRASLKLYAKSGDALVAMFEACGPERDPKDEG